MGKKLELVGKRFVRWLVLECNGARDGHFMWKCRCDCGVEKIVKGNSLVTGKSKSCGCLQKSNLSGQKFSRLLVLREADRTKGQRVLWVCRCDCGNGIVVFTSNLKSGNTKSCGCLQKEKTSQAKKLNLIGQRFGKLTVITEAGRDKYSRTFWKCLCDCGREKVVSSDNLKRGRTKSCGCYKRELMYIHGLSETKAYINAKTAKRRAIKLNQTPLDADLEEIRSIYKICSDMNDRTKHVSLSKKLPNGAWFHVDHEIPLSKGGLHHQDNLQVMWWTDNLSKHTKIKVKEKEIKL